MVEFSGQLITDARLVASQLPEPEPDNEMKQAMRHVAIIQRGEAPMTVSDVKFELTRLAGDNPHLAYPDDWATLISLGNLLRAQGNKDMPESVQDFFVAHGQVLQETYQQLSTEHHNKQRQSLGYAV